MSGQTSRVDAYRSAPLSVQVRPKVSLMHRLAHWLGVYRSRVLTVETVNHQGCGGQSVLVTECATCGHINAHQLRYCRPCLGTALVRAEERRDFDAMCGYQTWGTGPR